MSAQLESTSSAELAALPGRQTQVSRSHTQRICVVVDGARPEDVRQVLLRSKQLDLASSQVWVPEQFIVTCGSSRPERHGEAAQAVHGALNCRDNHQDLLMLLWWHFHFEQAELDYLHAPPPHLVDEEPAQRIAALQDHYRKTFGGIMATIEKNRRALDRSSEYIGRRAMDDLASAEALSSLPRIYDQPQPELHQLPNGEHCWRGYYHHKTVAIVEHEDCLAVENALLDSRKKLRLESANVNAYEYFMILNGDRSKLGLMGISRAPLALATQLALFGIGLRIQQVEIDLRSRFEAGATWPSAKRAAVTEIADMIRTPLVKMSEHRRKELAQLIKQQNLARV